jgi:hypothetical protein
MPERNPIEVKNLDIYGSEALPWSRARDELARPPDPNNPGGDRTPFLSTTGPDGSPDTAAVGAVWHDGDFYFTSGAGTRKSRNLAMHPRGTIAAHLKGIDVVLEGEVSRVTDAETLETLAKIYRDGGWPARVAGDAFTAEFSAPSAGPPPWNLYRFRIDTAFGVSTEEPWGATCWRFAP